MTIRRTFGWLRTGLPVVVLVACAALWWHGEAPPAPARVGWREDFRSVPVGGLPAGWEAPRGTFAVSASSGQHVLQLAPEPMVEGRVLLPGLLPGGGTVRARMTGARGKRTFPRFGVGLAQEELYKLLARPGEQVLEFVRADRVEVNGQTVENDTVLGSVPWIWNAETALWLELRVQPSSAGPGSAWEARCWPEGAPRPTEPQLRATSPSPPQLVRASLHLAPYAQQPIQVQVVEVHP